MFDLAAIQASLQAFQVDGWLLYDFRGGNPLSRRILDIPANVHTSRRFFYWIPATGQPRKLVHRIESGVLDHVPGEATPYLTWQELESGIRSLTQAANKLAMEYAPGVSNPYVARVDAGTVEFVRSLDVEVVSSGNLVQQFEAVWSDEQWEMHLEATRGNDAAFEMAWEMIRQRVSGSGSVHETEVQAAMVEHFTSRGLVMDHPPIVAVNDHSGNPHYAPGEGGDGAIRRGDFVLIDSWAKLDKPGAVYSDLTRVAIVDDQTPDHHAAIFRVVAGGRDAAINLVREAFAEGRPLQGWEVDRAARRVIDEAGYGAQFIHRLGHNIGEETHGNGANMDDLEMHDERMVMKQTCFSIEPGIYLPEFGIRSEVDVFVDRDGEVHVTGGPPQTEIKRLF